MLSDHFSKMSFFDPSDFKATFKFAKVAPNRKKDFMNPPELKTILTCKNLMKSGKSKHGFFALYDNLLVFYEEDNTPAKVLNLAQSRLKSLSPSRMKLSFGLVVVKSGIAFELLSSDKHVIDEWRNALRRVCVLDRFQEEYKSIKMIGKGSFAKVFLVESRATGKQYAAKTFHKETFINSNKAYAKPALINEIDIMRSLTHDNIIKLYEVHESDKNIHLVMELVQGKPLQDVLKRSSFVSDFSSEQVTEMIRSILDALAYITTKNLMHRDLKPANILLSKGGKIKIIDFGLATDVYVTDLIFKKCGTPGYIAPEVFKYNPKLPSTYYNEKCDVFSAGCILYYMLFGKPMLEGDNASRTLDKNRDYNGFEVSYQVKKEINNAHGRINKEGLNLILEMIQYDPKKRISASTALLHPYFKPVLNRMVNKVWSSKEIGDPRTPSHLQEGNSVNSIRSNQKLDQRSRFTEKSSLFLDVGRPEINGNMGTISNGSSVASGTFKGGSANSGSLSNFGKQNAANRNGKGSGRFGNQLVLKAANFQGSSKHLGLNPSQFRRKSEAVPREYGVQENEQDDDLSSPEIDSSELNDLGDENIQVQNCDRKKKVSPKRKTRVIPGFFKQQSRSLNNL